ncbi:MAG: hypothetical protein HYR94_01950, partial [Chloroflexi bacterium]|nr:hypothetical protein [Chloroflexota bacterium]
MADELKLQLVTLTKNLNTLREREAKYGGNAPLDLLNLIDDHLTAITLFQQHFDGQLTAEQLETELLPLNLAINRDIMGSAVAMGKGSQIIIQQAQSALDQARQQDAYEKSMLAEAVTRIASNLQALVSPFAKQSGPSSDTSQTFALSSSLIQGGKLAGSPYKALIDYKIPDAPLFYGRRTAIRELFGHLQPGTMTILHAESGAGKSSVLQAGLASRLLARGHLPLYLRPWNQDPALAIKRAFIPNLSKTPGLAQAPLLDFLRQVSEILGQNTRLYIFLDQFEEFFTLLDAERQANFVSELAACLEDPTHTTGWALALRDEYFGQVATFSPRIRNPFERQYLLRPFTLEEAKRVIAEPAARLKVTYEGDLVEQILQDLNLGQGALSPPEIQLVCSGLVEQLMEQHSSAAHTPLVITQQMYHQAGRAQGILRHHLTSVLEKNMSPHDRSIARRLLESLVTSDNRPAVRTLPELVARVQRPGEAQVEAETVDQVVQLLLDHRLVRCSDNPMAGDEGAYELAHAYLLTEIEVDPEAQAQKAAQELLDREVQSFRQYGTLLYGQKLGIIESQQAHLILSDDARELLRRSQANKNRRLYRRLGLALAIFAVLLFLAVSTGQFDVRAGSAAVIVFLILIALAGWAVAGRNEAKRAQKLALARGLSAEALNRLGTDAELSLLLALEAVKQTDLVQAENTLRQVLLQIRPWHILNSQSSGVLAVAWSPDGRRVGLGLKNGAIQLWDNHSQA